MARASGEVRVRLEGEPLNVLIRGESHLLSPDTPVAIKLPRP
jgi:hypothetical protein